MRISGVCCHLWHLVYTKTSTTFSCKTDYGGGAMIESALITITYLLFYGLVGVTIINVALLVIICYLLHKQ